MRTDSEQRTQERILVVEDEELVSNLLCKCLNKANYLTDAVFTAAETVEYLEKRTPDMILLDIGLPDDNGLNLLPRIKQMDEFISIVILTGQQDTATVVNAMRQGADSFLGKPFARDTLLKTVDQVLSRHRALRHDWVNKKAHSSKYSHADAALAEMVGDCPEIHRVRDLITRVAGTDASVVLSGETGTGKGLVAKAIHNMSPRADQPFVDVNCASLPSTLVESELFGHEKGAFTDAGTQKPGLLEVASGGTIFLDEIAELDPLAQSKLLKAIETHIFRRVGGVREISTNLRFIVAASASLEKAVRTGRFRQDLFYRLNVFEIALPPLRERGDDIDLLIHHFIRLLNPPLASRITGITDRAMELLRLYPWPGNVREVRNVIERAMILARGTSQILPAHLPDNLKFADGGGHIWNQPLSRVEEQHIIRVLDGTGGNIQRTAKILGISRSTLYAKLKLYDIHPSRLAASG
jgi:two-component system response regulator AtoC